MRKRSKYFVFLTLFFFIFTVSAQSRAELGNLVLKLVCFLWYIIPAIMALLILAGGIFIITGDNLKRDHGKKLIVNSIIAFFILIFVAWIVTLTTPDLHFSDYAKCFSENATLEYPTSSTIMGQQTPWADARVGAASSPIPEEKILYTGKNALAYFDASKSMDFDGTIADYEWNFGDNSAIRKGVSVSHSYAADGTYTAQLTVTDDDGLSDRDTVRIFILPLEAHILKPENNRGFVISDLEIQFDGEGLYGAPYLPPDEPYEYSWTSSIKGALSSEKSFTIKSSELGLGSHKINFTVTDRVGNTASDFITIHVVQPLVAEILSPENDAVTMGCPANFTGNVSGGLPPYQVKWKANGKVFGTGKITTDGGKNSLQIEPPIGLDMGTYEIAFEAFDSTSLSASDKKDGITLIECFQPLNLVFVPIGWSESDFASFKALADSAVDYFVQKYPVKECPNPKDRIKVYYIHPANCTVSSCADHCSDCISKARQCVIKNGLGGIYDKMAVVTKVGGGFDGGCAGGIPSDGESTSASVSTKVHTHEMGHCFGLGHVPGCNIPCHACMSGNPNCPDCSDPNVGSDIMNYCLNQWTHFGPKGYEHLKEQPFAPYIKNC